MRYAGWHSVLGVLGEPDGAAAGRGLSASAIWMRRSSMPWSRPVPAIDGRGEGRVSWFSATMGQMETQLEGGGFRGSAERKLYPPRPARCATWDGQRNGHIARR